jgi:flagellar biosynthesis protein FlhF
VRPGTERPETQRQLLARARSFEAGDMRQALRRVRRELGPDAVILSTRALPREKGLRGWLGRGAVRVMASAPAPRRAASAPPALLGRIEPAAPVPTPPGDAVLQQTVAPLVAELRSLRDAVGEREDLRSEVAQIRSLLTSWLGAAPFPEDAEGEAARRLFHFLLSRGIDEPLARSLAQRAVARVEPGALASFERLKLSLAAEMREDLRRAERGAPPGRVQLFAGPTGVGKTTTIAKLAARAHRVSPDGVLMLTTDVERPAAPEQMRRLGERVGVPVQVARDASELRDRVERAADRERIFVDTPGRSWRDPETARDLAQLCDAVPDSELLLVTAATARAVDTRALIEAFAGLPWSRLIVTRLDETRVFGELYNTIVHGGRPIAAITTGQGVPGQLEAIDTAGILRRVLHE